MVTCAFPIASATSSEPPLSRNIGLVRAARCTLRIVLLPVRTAIVTDDVAVGRSADLGKPVYLSARAVTVAKRWAPLFHALD
jgi:hypothetical protein